MMASVGGMMQPKPGVPGIRPHHPPTTTRPSSTNSTAGQVRSVIHIDEWIPEYKCEC